MKKLNALTSLRFVAAVMIVIFHQRGEFNLPRLDRWTAQFNFPQVLCWFFLLSGFILTYVHRELHTGANPAHYFRGRLARIWPSHLASLLLVLLVLPRAHWSASDHQLPSAALADIFLLQSWLPWRNYFYAFNSVAWTLSVECFFYACFPWLVYRWRETWLPKMLGAFAIVAIIVATVNHLDLHPLIGVYPGITADAFVTINPLARTFEFTLGMGLALIFLRLEKIKIPRISGTLLEIFALALITLSLHYSFVFCNTVAGWTGTGYPGAKWLHESGSCLAFAVSILVFALEPGWISRALSPRWLIYLGEASFAIYLLHQIWLRWYFLHRAAFAALPGWSVATIYWSFTLATSCLLFSFWEKPMRRLINRR